MAPTEHNDDDQCGFSHKQFLGGVVAVPFKWIECGGREFDMNLYAGSMMVSKDPESKALCPEIGSAVVDEEVEKTKKAIKERRFQRYPVYDDTVTQS